MKRISKKMKSFNYYRFSLKSTLIIFFSICLSSCSNDDENENPPVTITEISQDIKNLITFRGDEKAPTVLINAQAGPSTELAEDIVDFIVGTFDTTDILTVNVHQAQTLNPSILEGDDITLNQAVNFNNETVETLSQVIHYFKNQGRTVYVVGLSYGAFVTQELIAKEGIEVADKYLIMTGRLDINDIFWQGLAEGRFAFFENGVTPIVNSDPEMDVFGRNEARLFAGIIMNRYTERFNAIESLSNVTYIYGTTDEAVGSLTAEEVTFLQSKNATILSGSGGHDEPFEGFIKQGFSEAFGIE